MIDKIYFLLEQAWNKYKEINHLGNISSLEFTVEYPKSVKFGDFSSNIAMRLAPIAKQNPMSIATELRMYIEDDCFEKIEIVPPGFINFFVKADFLAEEVNEIILAKNNYGKNNSGQNKKIQVEFISANPTGPLTVGNGRGAFTGNCLINVFNFSGYKAKSEYLINDRGKQIDTLGESVIRRYLQEQGVKIDYPEDLYRGDYIKDLAKKIKLKDFKLSNASEIKKVREEIKEWALSQMIENIKRVVEEKCQVKFDKWFSEKSLYEGKLKENIWKFLEENNLIYKNENAWWFRSTLYKDDKDRVIVKKEGDPTYFFSDILYLHNRLKLRKFDKVLMIWGCDHHGDVPRVMAASKALGFDGRVDIILYQLVRLMLNGKEIRMSKRKGNFVTLEELVDEVGIDVVRWFFLMYEINSHMDFDLNLAKKKSEQNPVYYCQYAHARICSILAKIPKTKTPAPDKLEYSNSAEFALIKQLAQFPDVVKEVGETYATHKLPQYAMDLARKFHKFYADCRVMSNDEVNMPRLYLVKATKIVMANALKLMGISAPEKM
ncbi:MAG: arginine--tRNA ligase [Patescibacteria group bacterium]|jgi:arginyl-tRNA synthetase